MEKFLHRHTYFISIIRLKMIYRMRRSKQQIPEEEARQILNTATNGVLSLVDPDNLPYGVPFSFVYDGDKSIYFHCATVGRKIDCIRKNPNCCFSIINQDEIQPEKFTTYFRSVIAEGVVSILTDRKQMIDALRLLSAKYSPGIDCEQEIAKGIDRVMILQMEIETLSGKEAIEMTRQRNRESYQ